MGLYKLFSYNVEVQYKSCFLSKATIFTLSTVLLTLILPLIIAYKGRGFWLKTQTFYEQPSIRFTYEYLLVAELNDPGHIIVCGVAEGLYDNLLKNEEYCAEFQVQEHDINEDGKNDFIDFKLHLNVESEKTITSIYLILVMDFQLKTVCPLAMQSLAVIYTDFYQPSSQLKYFGDIEFYQTSHLPCKQRSIDARYNETLFNHTKSSSVNILDSILENYFMREVTIHTKKIYSRYENGNKDSTQMHIRLRIPEMGIRYTPSFMQELKWAWPQYLSLVVVFYWLFNKIKMYVFNKRLLMAWEVIPWKKNE